MLIMEHRAQALRIMQFMLYMRFSQFTLYPPVMLRLLFHLLALNILRDVDF